MIMIRIKEDENQIPYSTLSSSLKRQSRCKARSGLNKGDFYFINIYNFLK